VDAEHCVAGKVDSVDVRGNCRRTERRAESQVPVPHGQRKKMRHERGTLTFIQALDGRRGKTLGFVHDFVHRHDQISQ
jgi:hypothetical protein